MGDIAMTVPVLKAFAHQYPQIKITVLSRAFFRPLFEDIPNVDFFEADVKERHNGVFGLYRLFKELRELKLDAVADLHNVLRSNILKQYFKSNTVKFIQIDKGRAEKKALTREKDKKFKALKSTHERYADVFKKLGFPLNLRDAQLSSKKELNSRINEIIGADTRKWIGIAPFAAFEGKMYPLDLMEEVINTLDLNGKYKIILFGGGDREERLLNKMEAEYRNAVSVVGKLSFEEELQLISNLDLMVSMDSGNAHLAAMFGVKTVTLWGVTHPHAGFYPFGQNENNALLSDREKYPLIPTSVYGNRFPKGYEDVMRTIHPEAVVAKVEELA
ncbi:ADP-heptose--LPS heptosyltransferase RfaF [Leptobacterium flavescens]|uniref:ADP-heptose--LPS heptosyltransferase RfaF n=2 Tax=Leptobacterium flavescens TaxID=472055 RepID=A0A6P0UL19_9FLAO|nr:ADP-heptose--LPS heptosyltransferase RfaF [Leptobacterium flavescens]